MRERKWNTTLARQLLSEGHKHTDIAARLGISLSTLNLWRRQEKLSKPQTEWKEIQEEHFKTTEVNAIAAEAKRLGMTYGELVAARENPVIVRIPQGLHTCATRTFSAVERNSAPDNSKNYSQTSSANHSAENINLSHNDFKLTHTIASSRRQHLRPVTAQAEPNSL